MLDPMRGRSQGRRTTEAGMTRATVSGVSGDADVSLEISERTLSEIASILKPAGVATVGRFTPSHPSSPVRGGWWRLCLRDIRASSYQPSVAAW